MGARQNITVGTDGVTNYVEHEGSRYSLGTLAPVHFVVPLAVSPVSARKCLDSFLAEGSGRLNVDTEAMFELLENSRPRLVLAFMPPVQYGDPMTLTSFQTKVAALESMLKSVTARAAKMHSDRRASSLEADYKQLVAAAEELASDSQVVSCDEEEEVKTAAEIIDLGFDHPALKAIQASLDTVAGALGIAQKVAGIKGKKAAQIQRIVPSLEALSKTAAIVAAQIKEQAPEAEQDPETEKMASQALERLASAKAKIDAWHKAGTQFQVTKALLDVAETSKRVASTLCNSNPESKARMASLLAEAETIDAAFQAPR